MKIPDNQQEQYASPDKKVKRTCVKTLILDMLSDEDKDRIRQLQQDHKDGFMGEAAFESMRQTILDQAQFTFVAEKTAKRQKLDVDPDSRCLTGTACVG